MAAVTMPHSHIVPPRDEHTMDTRTPSPRPPHESSNDDNSDYQPDLSQEVSLLSTKLINAINYQTNLDDNLQHTRHELEAANREVAKLRAEKKSQDDMVANGLLVRKSFMDRTVSQLRMDLAKERAAREEAEKARKQTDAELESLTTALFEEANTMVAAARKDTEAMERRNSQLKGQISDTELLLVSQQEQLQDLKLTMGRMSERGDNDTTAGRDSVPSTPIGSSAAMFDAMQLSPNASTITDIPPEHPLYFSHLLTPILRSDVPAYTDFQDLLQSARKAMPHSRAPSTGTTSGGLSSSSQTNLATISSPHLPGAFSFSTNSSPQSTNFASTAPPLKDTKFYKRSLVEDIEPTLRLDLAPGLSFLSRRTVFSSLLLGSMVVEPFMPQTKYYGPIFACALCGESRKAEPYVRKHRFRTSEEESAQRYPLCDYCLGRTRAAGDFVGFLRMVRDGHWRAESEEEQKGAWEEAVRLRERMFWARLGGGVIPSLVAKQSTPSTAANVKSARQSLESIAEQESSTKRASQAIQAAQMVDGELMPREVGVKSEPDEKLLDVLKNHRQSMTVSAGAAADLGLDLAAGPPPAVPGVAASALPQQESVEPESTVSSQEVEAEVELQTLAVIEVEPAVAVPEPEPEVESQALAVEPTVEPAVIAVEPTVAVPEPELEIETEVSTAEPVVLAVEPTVAVPALETETETLAVEPAMIAVPEPEMEFETPAAILQPESTTTTTTEDPTAIAPEPIPSTLELEPEVEVEVETTQPAALLAPAVPLPETSPAPEQDDTAAPTSAIPEPDTPSTETPVPISEVSSPQSPPMLQTPTLPTERRPSNSSVLARVRAMESEPRAPGSFD